MSKINIIADIAGRYNELMKLLEVMPKADKIVLVGDLVDRGPDSKKVVEWAMKGVHEGTPIITLYGNHEDIFVEGYLYGYPMEYAANNGFMATMKSYNVMFPDDYPESHVRWMTKLPIYHREERLFISHAPWLGNNIPEANNEDLNKWKHTLIWNRYPPGKKEGVFQVHGHNHVKEKYDDWGICIDNCSQRVLTGLHWPTKDLYEVAYEDINV